MTDAIIVTGAAGALGRAITEELAGHGWQVIGVDRAPAAPADIAHYFGGTDLTEANAVKHVFSTAASLGHRIAGLVNVAGGFAWEMLCDGSIETWDKMYSINLRTAVNCCAAALPLLRLQGGAIVNIGAAASLRAGSGMGAYAASKAGISRLTEALAEEEKDLGIRVNAILPSIIDTPANRLDMPDADHTRWVTPKALAEVVAFLLSDGARAITGANLPVTGRV